MDPPRRYRMSARAQAAQDTRRRIAEAARDRFTGASYDRVTLTSIATAAGVSQQTVLNQFGSKAGLFRAAMELVHEEVVHLRGRARRGDVPSVVRVLVDQYEVSGDAHHGAGAVADQLPVVAELLAQARAGRREWLAEILPAGLPSDPRERQRALAARHAATDVAVWWLLRRGLGLSVTDTARVMERLLGAALAADP